MGDGDLTFPAHRTVRTLECTGSGTFYFQNDALKHRFIWYVVLVSVAT
jgi:hypothetical protein